MVAPAPGTRLTTHRLAQTLNPARITSLRVQRPRETDTVRAAGLGWALGGPIRRAECERTADE
ncbi:hypothetical protein AURDEDRAFT_163491 [Auricularia subglabra TFB-10046 SS5]|nr:hypothetical protein AURDEDRAFT_163491 [Auricularia subglabra TFB-10046 SS5]